MKALVTGAAGFIGSRLCAELRSQGIQVKEADLVYGQDLRKLEVAEKAVTGTDVIFHLAADSNVASSVSNHTKDLAGPAMTVNILEAAVKEGVRNVVFASSSAVYGDTKDLPTTEEARTNPISLYGAAKLSSEAFAKAFTVLAPIRVCVLRFGNPLGETMRKGVVYQFVQALKKDPKRLHILGDGDQTRSFFYVGDCVQGLLAAPGWMDERFSVYNIAGGSWVTLDRTAEIIIEEMGLGNVEITHEGGERGWRGDIIQSQLSILKARDSGYNPTMDAETTVRRTVRWMIEN